MKKLSTLVVALLISGCPPPVVPNPPPTPVDTDMCEAAEQNLERLSCKDSHGNPMWVNKRGERFQETCRMAQEEALIFLDPRCVSESTTCTGANSCPTLEH